MTPPQSIFTTYRTTSKSEREKGSHFEELSPEEAADRPNAPPIFDIKIAAGDFSKEQWLKDCQYAELPEHFTGNPGFFIAQVLGKSMPPLSHNVSRCLFREPSDGSRNRKVVIVRSRDIRDSDPADSLPWKSSGATRPRRKTRGLTAVSDSNRIRTAPHFNPRLSKPTNPPKS